MYFAGADGMLQVRFLHEPSAPHAFCGAALSSTLVHFTYADEDEKQDAAQAPTGDESVVQAAAV